MNKHLEFFVYKILTSSKSPKLSILFNLLNLKVEMTLLVFSFDILIFLDMSKGST